MTDFEIFEDILKRATAHYEKNNNTITAQFIGQSTFPSGFKDYFSLHRNITQTGSLKAVNGGLLITITIADNG